MRNLLSALLLFSILYSCNTGKVQEVSFSNPILPGFYPDPSICRVENDYYLVNSTFSFFPGIPIFHSTDLVNWNQIGNVLDRPEQLNLEGLGISQGIYAPAIRYHKGTFYLVCTVVGGIGNFVVTAKNPAGPWSVPVALPHVQGMDPDIFFDTDGKAYLTSCWPAPDNKPLYDGHRSIRTLEFFPETLTTGTEEKLLANGGADISKEPIWIEGPHIYKVDDYYYLMAAEGGTSTGHSEVIFRAKAVTGPYEVYEKNPILTQRNLDPARENPITCTGHADLVETPEGEWFSVFLGCRPYENGFFNTGRETFMTPVTWKDGWPVINPDSTAIQYSYSIPSTGETTVNGFPLNKNFVLRDSFNTPDLAPYWLFIRTPFKQKHSIDKQNGGLVLALSPEMLNQFTNPAFIGRRQQHLHAEAAVSMVFKANSAQELAGISAFQNDANYYLLAKTLVDNKEAVVLYKSVKSETGISPEILAVKFPESHERIYLKIKADKGSYSFYFATTEGNWLPVAENVDGKYLSTEVAGGFVGTILGMHASATGTDSGNTATFEWFEYSGNDPTFLPEK